MRVWTMMAGLGLITTQLMCLPCRAMLRISGRFPTAVSVVRTPPKAMNLYCDSPDFRKGFDLALVRPVESRTDFNNEDVSKVIPADLRPSSDSGQIAAKIVDRSLTSWFNSSAIQNSGLGRTAHSVEDSLNKDMSVGGSEADSVKHSFKFNVRAAQTKALLQYEGLTNAQLSYQIASSRLDFELREPMSALATDLVFNHTVASNDSRDIVSVRWAW